MNINIITVGKIKEAYIRAGIDEFSKRLSKYCKLTIIEVPDRPTRENASEKENKLVKDQEGDILLKKLPKGYNIGLVIEGRQLTSEVLAEKIEGLGLEGTSDINFIIGGSLGLSDNVLDRLDYKLSFSKMTFPHQLMRLILLEQVYRSFRIIKSEPYHK